MADTVYVFDLSNKQDHYARCMQLIFAIEKSQRVARRSIEEWDTLLQDGQASEMSVSAYQVKEIGNLNSVTQLTNIIKNLEENKYVDIIHSTDENYNKFLMSLSNGSFKQENKYMYYIRINDNVNDFSDLTFFVLLLQSQGVPTEKICVYIKADKSQNAVDCYYRFSDYLSLIDFDRIFALYKTKDISEIRRLNDVSKANVSRKFVPIFNVNSENLDIIFNSKHILKEINDGSNIVKLNKREGGAIAEEIGFVSSYNGSDRLLKSFVAFANNRFSSLFGDKFKAYQNKRIKLLNALVSEIHGSIPFVHFLLLVLMIGSDAKISELAQMKEDADLTKKYKDFWRYYIDKSGELYDSVYQIAENSVNHSETHCGLISFVECKDKTEENKSAKSKYTRFITVVIADSGSKSVIDTFKSNTEKCPEYLRNSKLETRDLFIPLFDDQIKENVAKFRKESPDKCQGLIKFATHISDLGCSALYRSSSNFIGNLVSDIWHSGEDFDDEEARKINYIPGTQVKFNFRGLESDTKNEKPVFVHNPVYDNYAAYLDCDPNPIRFDCRLSKDLSAEFTGQELKDKYVELFRDKWSELLRNTSKNMLYIDFSDMNMRESAALQETICKGLMAASVEYLKNDPLKSIRYIFLNIPRSLYVQMRLTLQYLNDDYAERINIVGKVDGGVFDTVANSWPSLYDVIKNKEILPVELFDVEGKGIIAEMNKVAEQDLLSISKHGYRLSDIHMRLGSKVHLDTFYQMSTFFNRHENAVRTAFVLCKQLLPLLHKQIRENQTYIMLFGYEAYSRHIIFCMHEILKRYCLQNGYNLNIEFALYQSDRIDELKTMSQSIYFRNEKFNDKMEGLENYKWVLIVPISTTLTTFKKMWAKLSNVAKDKNLSNENIIANMTAFWVVDDIAKPDGEEKLIPTKSEEKYWKEADLSNKTIKLNDDDKFAPNSVFYFLTYKNSKWHSPLTCDECFCSNPIDEIPLLETDISSTVPEQQYYLSDRSERVGVNVDASVNEDRLLDLFGCVYYGHYERSGNHYQYYINLPKYFQREKEKIRLWLEPSTEQKKDKALNALRENMEGNEVFIEPSNEQKKDKALDVLRENMKGKEVFIVSSQNNADIEFGLYICNYLCGGLAQTISIDANRHFRSNVEAEYADIIKRVSNRRDDCYYLYVDTSIVSGRGIQRISSVMDNIANSEPRHFNFDGIMMLANRISNSSAKQYIKEGGDLVSFVDIGVSHLRTHGDSCTCCKLSRQYDRVISKAATPNLEAYYTEKAEINELCNFSRIENHKQHTEEQDKQQTDEKGKQQTDEKDKQHTEEKDIHKYRGFLRLLISYYAKNRIKRILNVPNRKSDKEYIDAIKDILLAVVDKEDNIVKKAQKKLQENNYNGIDNYVIVHHTIRVLGRPFFSYNYITKSKFMSAMLGLAELMLDNGKYISEFYDKKNEAVPNRLEFDKFDVECIKQLFDIIIDHSKNISKDKESFVKAVAEILMDDIFKILVNLNSNYILRRQTIKKLIVFLTQIGCTDDDCKKIIEKYFHLAAFSLKVSEDESKAFRCEWLFHNGREYTENQKQKDLVGDIEYYYINKCFGLNEEESGRNVISKFIENFFKPLLIENNTIVAEAINDIGSRNEITMPNNRIYDKIYKSANDKVESDYNLSNIELLKNLLTMEAVRCKQFETDKDKAIKSQIAALLGIYYVLDLNKKDSLNGKSFYDMLQSAIIKLSDNYFFVGDSLGRTRLSIFGRKRDRADGNAVTEPNIYNITGELDHASEVSIDGFKQYLAKTGKALEDYSFYYDKDNGVIILSIADYDTASTVDIIYFYIQLQLDGNRDPISEKAYLYFIKNVLTFRNAILSVIKKDFDTDFMQLKYNTEIAARLTTADKAGDHVASSEFDALYAYLKLKDTKETVESNQSANDMYANLVHKDNESTEWLLLYNYTNRKIARLYNKMISTVFLNDEFSLQFENLYPHTGYTDALESLDLSESSVDPLDDTIVRSRKNILKIIFNEFKFTVEGKAIEDIDEFIECLRKYRFISLETVFSGQRENYSYSKDYFFICVLLDFCYSALKNMDLGLADAVGIVSKYQYLHTHKDVKCEIDISSEEFEFNNKKYKNLVLKDRYCKESGLGKGMSLQSIEWYINYLWKKHCEAEEISEKIPKATHFRDEKDFILKLPILSVEKE